MPARGGSPSSARARSSGRSRRGCGERLAELAPWSRRSSCRRPPRAPRATARVRSASALVERPSSSGAIAGDGVEVALDRRLVAAGDRPGERVGTALRPVRRACAGRAARAARGRPRIATPAASSSSTALCLEGDQEVGGDRRRRRGRRHGTPRGRSKGRIPSALGELAGDREGRVARAGDRSRRADEVGRRRRGRSAADAARTPRRRRCVAAASAVEAGRAARVPDEPRRRVRRRSATEQAARRSRSSGTQRSDASAPAHALLGEVVPAGQAHVEPRRRGGALDRAAHAAAADQDDRWERGGVCVGRRTSVPVLGRDTRRRVACFGRWSRCLTGPRPCRVAAGRLRRMIPSASARSAGVNTIEPCRSTSSNAGTAGSGSRSSPRPGPRRRPVPPAGPRVPSGRLSVLRAEPPADAQSAPPDGGRAGNEPRRRPAALQVRTWPSAGSASRGREAVSDGGRRRPAASASSRSTARPPAAPSARSRRRGPTSSSGPATPTRT